MNCIAITSGNARNAVVSGIPSNHKKTNRIGSASKKWMRLLAIVTAGRTAAGKPGRLMSSRLSTIALVAW